MRFFDFLEEYYRNDRICILSLSCEDLYFLIRNRGTVIDELMLREISRSEAQALKNNAVAPANYLANSSDWFPLSRMEGMYTEEQLTRLAQKVEEHKKKRSNEIQRQWR